MKSEYDVIVVGAGGSGLAAACTAAEAGAEVLVLEKQPQPGGTTGIAVGSFTGNRTSLQQQANVDDNPDDHEEDAGKFAPPDIEARNHSGLRRYFLDHTAETFEWLRGLGLSFYGPSPEPPNRVPRMHNVVPGAKAYIAALQLELFRRGGELFCDADVCGLLQVDTRVAGVRVRLAGSEQEIRARRGVILAAGDYASGTELIREYKGDKFTPIEGINPHASGDGHRLALEAGGQLLNMDVTYGPELRFVAPPGKPFQQLLPTHRSLARLMAAATRWLPKSLLAAFIKRLLVTWQHPEDALFADGAILVNRHGERFTNERNSPARETDLARQPDKVAYLLLDQRLVERYSAWPHFISTAPDIAYAYVDDYRRLRPDVTVDGETLAELAAKRNLDPATLEVTVAAFNRYAAGEAKDPFGRTGDEHPLEGGPWVLLGPAKAYFTTTEGGAAINEQCQVLTADGSPVPGLYAVGQNGLGGMILWGHGLHIAWALTSGRIAGRAAARGDDKRMRDEG